MSKKSKREYSLFDHVFAISTVLLMCIFIIVVPFLLFYGVFRLASLTPDITINSSGTFDSIVILLKFFTLTVVIIGIADVIFSQILLKKRGIINYIVESLFMFLLFYLYILIYSIFSHDIIFKNNGVALAALFLFVLYLLISVVYAVSQRIYRFVLKKIQEKHN
ncbi:MULTISPECIES: hypothetical protein [Bacillus]|uniref:Uncharacterized protein n=1 Tax=Bacillus glycinifermentans TaxID=1664069 RepID=A0AAJ3YVB0_9BACI|nr:MULTISPECIES: hypothetical protein [Bacillus]KKB72967.1 hypothetical protein TH62_14825 [Bacillus sp. TH008]MDU0073766.1 hypothetical protein [Bacillus sp. IG6]MED8021640.1 hypothetical protein [Bacillus glycinifermentans]QAT63940.1 hypothetical protein EQZ20_02595 [Bacillus glycinifermentans]WKB77821.1 hypothetical protein QYM22_02635 [Bacillus glycinifermentans]